MSSAGREISVYIHVYIDSVVCQFPLPVVVCMSVVVSGRSSFSLNSFLSHFWLKCELCAR